jgi:hypothetical protein
MTIFINYPFYMGFFSSSQYGIEDQGVTCPISFILNLDDKNDFVFFIISRQLAVSNISSTYKDNIVNLSFSLHM